MLSFLLGGALDLFFASLAAILLALAIHEFAHAYVAYRLGDDTAASLGRMTLNPFAHVDVTGLIFLVVAGFGWGKPVPVNVERLRGGKLSPLAVSLAGPLFNFALAVAVGLAARLIGHGGPLVTDFLTLFVVFNLILGAFNLLPIPPLDGSSVLFAVLPPTAYRVEAWLRTNGLWLLLGLVVALRFGSWNPFGGLYRLAGALLGL